MFCQSVSYRNSLRKKKLSSLDVRGPQKRFLPILLDLAKIGQTSWGKIPQDVFKEKPNCKNRENRRKLEVVTNLSRICLKNVNKLSNFFFLRFV
jgi:hypothetical protein